MMLNFDNLLFKQADENKIEERELWVSYAAMGNNGKPIDFVQNARF